MWGRSSVRQRGPPLIGDALVASGAMRQARPMVARPSGIELQSWDVTAAMRTGGTCPAVSEANGQPLPGGLGGRLYLRCADHRHCPVSTLGRAACRERVYQYVAISLDDVSSQNQISALRNSI